MLKNSIFLCTKMIVDEGGGSNILMLTQNLIIVFSPPPPLDSFFTNLVCLKIIIMPNFSLIWHQITIFSSFNYKTWLNGFKRNFCCPACSAKKKTLVAIFLLSIYILSLSVRLYPINVKTAEQIRPVLCMGPHMTPGKVYGWLKFKSCIHCVKF